MHRTYSMRQSRAPTRAQILDPPPPPSSTKSGRLFGRNNFSHAFRKTAAGAFGPELAKKLSQLVKMEKNVMRSMELVGRERREVARHLSVWGEECDEDVSDITDKLGVLIYEIGELEDQFIDKYDQYRVTIKSIRNIEASVQPSRDRKQKITDQIAQLKYKDPESPKIVVLEQELVRAEAESLVAEAQLSNITREKIKAAFNYQFDALREHCEKVAMIAGYGKHLLELIDDTPVTPGETREAYDGYEASKSIIQDCEQALIHWIPARAAVKSTLSRRSRSQSAARRARARGEGISLAHQDRPMKTGSSVWVPASEHERKQRGHITDDDEYEDIEDEEELYGQQNDGRHHHHHHAHANGHSHVEDETDVSPPSSRGNEARQRSTKGANGVSLNASERERGAGARGETPAGLLAARAVTPAQE
ncbi:Eisosome component PIL1-domain-containing protein [Tirmania nivea]|nr:Eisosome component PIL1-domain-containing protein [Tirmania nivea]